MTICFYFVFVEFKVQILMLIKFCFEYLTKFVTSYQKISRIQMNGKLRISNYGIPPTVIVVIYILFYLENKNVYFDTVRFQQRSLDWNTWRNTASPTQKAISSSITHFRLGIPCRLTPFKLFGCGLITGYSSGDVLTTITIVIFSVPLSCHQFVSHSTHLNNNSQTPLKLFTYVYWS